MGSRGAVGGRDEVNHRDALGGGLYLFEERDVVVQAIFQHGFHAVRGQRAARDGVNGRGIAGRRSFAFEQVNRYELSFVVKYFFVDELLLELRAGDFSAEARGFAFMVEDCAHNGIAVVAKGDVDVAAVSDQILQAEINSGNVKAGDIKVIATSDPIPSEGMIIRADMDQNLRKTLTEFLLQYANEDYFAKVIKVKGARFVEASKADYQPIIELNQMLSK